jgi:hypothetical protein
MVGRSVYLPMPPTVLSCPPKRRLSCKAKALCMGFNHQNTGCFFHNRLFLALFPAGNITNNCAKLKIHASTDRARLKI